jgi:hypothetical protein
MSTVAPRTFANDEPADDIEEDLVCILVTARACQLTAHLVPPVERLLAELSPTRDRQTQLERAVAQEEAKIPFIDDVLNLLLDETKKEVPAQLDAEQAAAIMARLFEKRSPSELRRFTLGEQHETQRGWPDILTPLQNPRLTDIAYRITQAVKAADDVLSNQAKAQTELDTFLLGPRADYVATCNKERGAVFGKILEISKDPASGPLPADFVNRFFLRDTSGRVKRLPALEAEAARLRARLAKVEARCVEARKKIEDAAAEKIAAEIRARTAKLDEAQKTTDDEKAAIAALKAKLDPSKKP